MSRKIAILQQAARLFRTTINMQDNLPSALHWVKLEGKGNAPPTGRSSHTVSAVGNRIYVYGGEDIPRNPFDPDMHCFDLDQQEWIKLDIKGTPPTLRLAHGAAVVGDTIFIIGGRNAQKEDLCDVHAFNTSTNTWRSVETSGESLPTCSYHAVTTVGKDVIAFGGCHGTERLNQVYKLDTETAKWHHMQVSAGEAPTPRGGPGLVGYKGSIYVYAGYQGKAELDDLHHFDLATNSWTKIESPIVPPARSVHSTNLLGKGLAIYGGECAPSLTGHEGAGKYLNDTWVYNFASKEWTSLEYPQDATPPPPRGWQASTSVFNAEGEATAVAMFGGYNGIARLHDLYLLRL